MEKKKETEARRAELEKIFANIDEAKAGIVKKLIVELVFLEDRLDELRKLPFIRIHPNDPTRQQYTPAGKQYKELMQSYLNAVKVLTMLLSRYGVEEQDAFEQWLESKRL